jgi:hypothetical protein
LTSNGIAHRVACVLAVLVVLMICRAIGADPRALGFRAGRYRHPPLFALQKQLGFSGAHVRLWFNTSSFNNIARYRAPRACWHASKVTIWMSTTIAEILQRMVSVDGWIVALRSPTPAYKKHIAVCRADGVAVDILSSEILDELVEANLVQEDHRENETKIFFKLTDDGRAAAKEPLEKYLKAKLVSLGYPWPDNLEAKSIAWLEAEIRAIAPLT